MTIWLDRGFGPLDKWLPADWPELDIDTLKHSLPTLAAYGNAPDSYQEQDDRVDILRVACCLFWQVYYRYKEFSADDIQPVRNAWGYRYEPDGQLDWLRAFVSIHVNAAFALYLYRTEPTHSEAFIEAVEDAAALASRLRTTLDFHEPGVFYSTDPYYYARTQPANRSLGFSCALGWCFKSEISTASSHPVEALDAAFKAIEDAYSSDWLCRPWSEAPLVGIQNDGAPLGAVVTWMRLQTIVDAFDNAYDAVGVDVDWADIAFRCDEMHLNYESALAWGEAHRYHIDDWAQSRHGTIYPTGGRPWTPHMESDAFWTFARGLCTNKLTPDMYRDLREKDERHAAESRLRNYFFRELWELVPHESQQALITADRIYSAPEGRKGDILENLRLAVEPIVENRMVKPFQTWFAARANQPSKRERTQRREPTLGLTKMVDRMWGDSQVFCAFAQEIFPEIEAGRWDNLRKALGELTKKRNRSTHDDQDKTPNTDEIFAEYRKFVGIGEAGVLPELLRLRPNVPSSSPGP